MLFAHVPQSNGRHKARAFYPEEENPAKVRPVAVENELPTAPLPPRG